MKSFVKVLFIGLLFIMFYCKSDAQELTPETKAQLIYNLANADSVTSKNYSWYAARAIKEYKIVEAIPALVDNLWKQKPYVQLEFLETLQVLGYNQTHGLTLAFIDSVDDYEFINPQFDRLLLKAQANLILFKQGDYSKRNYLFEMIDKFNSSVELLSTVALPFIIKNVSQDEEKAKSELIRIANYSPSHLYRYFAIMELYEIYGIEILPLVKQIFLVESQSSSRAVILENILSKINNSQMNDFLKNQALVDTSNYIKNNILEILLNKYGSPVDYQFVSENLRNLPTIYNNVLKHYVKGFKPFIKNDSKSLRSLIDSLYSYGNQCASFNWLGDHNFSFQLQSTLSEAQQKLASNDSLGTAVKIKQYQSLINQAYKDSAAGRFVTADGYKFLYYYPQYILERLPKLPIVKLENSSGSKLQGGSLQYYEGAWKDAVDNGDGTFSVNTQQKTVSLRMTYAYGSQTKSNVTVGTDTVVFQTVNTQVRLQNSQGIALDTGRVQYYAGAWREFGTTSNGIAAKELLPNNYSFRMSYAYASNDKQQIIGNDPNVIFKTVNANVQLQNSLGNLIDQGTVQYYAGAWRDFGTTSNGAVTKELLPNNYSFRMSYAYASNDKQQNIGNDPNVIFKTVNANVQLQNSLGNPIDQGTVQYYSGAWRDFGSTSNGVAAKELLPNNYSFRMSYAYATNDKQQNIGSDPNVIFKTVKANVQLQNSFGNPIDVGTVQYYAGAWREFGTTLNGLATKELLPNNYSFRMTHDYISKDISQNIGTNNIVKFSTVLCTIRVKDAQNNLLNNAIVSYYAGAWRQIGSTVNGEITKELLPANLSFRANYYSVQKDKTQDISTNGIIEFTF